MKIGGSRSSSIANSTGSEILRCGCNISMKMFVSNIQENPRRKFWRCKNYGKSEVACDLFVWDDEVDDLFMSSRNTEVFRGEEMECNNCKFTIGHLKGFAKEYGKEFGIDFSKEYGKEACPKKVEKLKKMVKIEKEICLQNMFNVMFFVYHVVFFVYNVMYHFGVMNEGDELHIKFGQFVFYKVWLKA
ncbi:unnamed protein product [Lathyrus sativus]|nr:unnamed protein product [Lathyrus sativus]